MIISFIDSLGNKNTLDIIPVGDIRRRVFQDIDYTSKKEFLQKFLSLYEAGEKLVLFDKNHRQLQEFYTNNNINHLDNIEGLDEDTQLLFFTSGSSGFPVGAFKTRENLESEVAVLKALVQSRITVKKVVVTVPFVHIYGVLAGILLPLSLGDIEVVVKEDFLPYEILHEIENTDTLVITTPVFIKALTKVQDSKRLDSCLFISSTGPLDEDNIAVFEAKYNTTLLQLFGSTETGGIAFKFSTSREWKPLDGVKIEQYNEKLAISSPFISEYILTKELQKIDQPFVTEDIVKLKEEGFELLGRSNKIIKIAGKRISTMAIELLLEEMEVVQKAVVIVVYKKNLLRSEQMIIYLEAEQQVVKKDIKETISKSYGVLTIPFEIKYVDKINLSAMGKKIIF